MLLTTKLPTYSLLKTRTDIQALAIMTLVVCFDMLAGPLRYYLSQYNIDYITYLPKILAVIFILKNIFFQKFKKEHIYFIVFFAFYSCIGFLQGVTLESNLFFALIITPFVFGIITAKNIIKNEKYFFIFFALVFLVTATGIILDPIIDFPWKGYTYRIGDKEIIGSMQSSTYDFDRVAGFARGSAAAAFYVVSSALFLISYKKSWWIKLFVFTVALSTVALTTNKAAMGGLILGIIFLSIVRLPLTRKCLVYVLASALIIIPLSSLLINYNLKYNDFVGSLLLSSFDDRLRNTWPSFFSAVSKFGNPLTGVGFGGVGSAVTRLSTQNRFVLGVADNFLLYLYGSFGVSAIVLILYLVKTTTILFTSQNNFIKSIAPVMVGILGASLTTDVIESQIFSLVIGIAVGFSRYTKLHYT